MHFTNTFSDINTPAKYYRCEAVALITEDGFVITIPDILEPTLVPFSDTIFTTGDILYLNSESRRIQWAADLKKAFEWLEEHKSEIENKFYIRVVIWYDTKVSYRTHKADIGKRPLLDLLTQNNIAKKVKIIFKRITLLPEQESPES